MKKPLELPKFATEEEERHYWDKFDLADHTKREDLHRATFPNLRPTSRSISIRLPEHLLNRIKERANRADVPYQSMIKTYLEKAVRD